MKDKLKYEAKRRSLVSRLLRWLLLVIGAVTVFQSGYFLVMRLAFGHGIAFPSRAEKIGFALVNVIAVVFLGWLLSPIMRRSAARLVRTPDGRPALLKRVLSRVLNKRMVPRYLFCLAGLATLIGLFYAVENWRGKRAWEKCRRELEARGEVLDWNAYIPAPVPDEQNIFKAPKMAEWFVKESWTGAFSGNLSQSRNTNAPFNVVPPRDVDDGHVVVAEVTVVPPNGPLPSGKADAVLRFDDPPARERAAKFLRESIGPCAEGAQYCVLVPRPLDRTNPACLLLRADTTPTATALAAFLSLSGEPNQLRTTLGLSQVRVATAGSNGFRVLLTASVYTASDYLARSQPAVPDLDLLRQALERPCARMDGDYQRPFERPIPNFVRQRTAAQVLSQRAQCYLLLGQPEAAWHELALVRDLCRMLEAKPASNCPLLVEAMIDVAIGGLYVSVVQDGLRLQAWREPELAAIQKQLGDINFIPLVQRAFQAERAGSGHTFETYTPTELARLFDREEQGLWGKLRNPMFLFATLAPRGWMFQNMCAGEPPELGPLGAFDVTNNQVWPSKNENAQGRMAAALKRKTPYNILARMTLPNFSKACQTTARNQTLANEAFIACGLKRYRLAHGQYPETLEALVPQFAEKLPHDIVGGRPLKYSRTADGQFVLYSVGWNEKDDGGTAGKTITEGDWVWP